MCNTNANNEHNYTNANAKVNAHVGRNAYIIGVQTQISARTGRMQFVCGLFFMVSKIGKVFLISIYLVEG